MAKRVFSVASFTPTATADTTALANGTYMAIGAGSTTQVINIVEFYEVGQAAASAINIMQFARDSTLAVTPTALAAPNADGPVSGATAALAAPPITYVAAGTAPQRSALTTGLRLNLGFNAAGGILRWKPADQSETIEIIGQTANISECSLSCWSAGTPGLMGAHIMYEPK